jgi:predicted membrane protein
MEKISYRYYSCWDNERLIKVGDDGSWCIKFVDVDVISRTDEYTPAEVEQMEKKAIAAGSIGFMNFRHNLFFWQGIKYAFNITKLEVAPANLVILAVLVGHDQYATMMGDGVLHCHDLCINMSFAIIKLGYNVWEICKPVVFTIGTMIHGYIQCSQGILMCFQMLL